LKNSILSFLSLSALLLLTTIAQAEKYNLSVQPILPAKNVMESYKPLVRYLSEQTGHEFSVVAYREFLSYWVKMRKGKDMHFILDAAHFTDYRIQRKDYETLVKLPDTVSFTVVTSEDNFIFEMDELVSKKIATMPSPGLGAIRLNQMFPNPARLPFFVQATDSVDAANKVLDGSVDAAIIPTPLVGNYPSFNAVLTTEPVPHMALSASSEVPASVKEAVKKALLDAPNTEKGRKMLTDMNIAAFQDANTELYAGFADLLEGVFGY